MKYRLVLAIWVFTLILMCAGAEDLSYLFWFSFIGFCCMNVYIQRHEKRLLKEVDEDLGEMK